MNAVRGVAVSVVVAMLLVVGMGIPISPNEGPPAYLSQGEVYLFKAIQWAYFGIGFAVGIIGIAILSIAIQIDANRKKIEK